MSDSSGYRRLNPELLQGRHLRAARALLDWGIPVAAERCGVGVNTINRFEKGHRSPGHAILRNIVETFEAHGVVFVDTSVGSGLILNERYLNQSLILPSDLPTQQSSTS